MAPNQENIEAKLCAYVDDELTAQERIEIEQHLATNPHHRRLLKELAQTRILLQALPRAQSPADLVEEFQSQLERNALLDDEQAEPAGAILYINRQTQALAAAAILLLAVGLAVVIYKVLPPSSPHREVAIVPTTPTPGLVTADDSSATDTMRPTTAAGARALPPPEGLVRDVRKEMASSGSTPGGGGGGSFGGGGRGGQGPDNFVGKGGLGTAGKSSDGAKFADAHDVISVRGKIAMQEDPRGGVAGGMINATNNPSRNGSGTARSELDLTTAVEEQPVVVVVNTTNPVLANGDVSLYLRENNIKFSEEAETSAVSRPIGMDEGKVNAAPAPAPATPVPSPVTPASQGSGSPVADAVRKSEVSVPPQKKPGWYMGSDGQVHFGRGDDADVAKAKQVEPLGGTGIARAGAEQSSPAKPSAASGPVATQPLRGVEFVNGFNGISNYASNASNPVTYRALMSRRQVLDLNSRLSLREGQSAEIRSDALAPRPEGYALGNSMRQSAQNTAAIAGVTPPKQSESTSAPPPEVGAFDKAGSSGRRGVVAAKGVESATGQADGGTGRDAAKSSQLTGEITPGPAGGGLSQAKDFDGMLQRSRMAKAAGNDRTGGRPGEKSAPVPSAATPEVAPSLPAQLEPPQQAERDAAEQTMVQRRTLDTPTPSHGGELQQQPGRQAISTPESAAKQQFTQSQAPSVSTPQEGVAQNAATASRRDPLTDDEQPHAVVILVPAPTPATALPPAVPPATRPTTAVPATRPAEPTPTDSK